MFVEVLEYREFEKIVIEYFGLKLVRWFGKNFFYRNY